MPDQRVLTTALNRYRAEMRALEIALATLLIRGNRTAKAPAT